MKRVLLFVSIIAVALFAYGDDGGRRFTVVLTGAEEAGWDCRSRRSYRVRGRTSPARLRPNCHRRRWARAASP